MDIREFIKQKKEKESKKCEELRENIKVLIDEGFESRGEILGIMMDFYGISKTNPKFKKFIQCFNKIMNNLTENESEW